MKEYWHILEGVALVVFRNGYQKTGSGESLTNGGGYDNIRFIILIW